MHIYCTTGIIHRHKTIVLRVLSLLNISKMSVFSCEVVKTYSTALMPIATNVLCSTQVYTNQSVVNFIFYSVLVFHLEMAM